MKLTENVHFHISYNIKHESISAIYTNSQLVNSFFFNYNITLKLYSFSFTARGDCWKIRLRNT